jgi:hypothetical protein
MKELEKEAYKLRNEFYNKYENQEIKWHEKYQYHPLYAVVVESFRYRFHEIGEKMPFLLEKFK